MSELWQVLWCTTHNAQWRCLCLAEVNPRVLVWGFVAGLWRRGEQVAAVACGLLVAGRPWGHACACKLAV